MKTAWERNEFCRGEILERCYEFMFLCVQNKVCIVFTVSMVSVCVWKLHVLNWLCPMRVWRGGVWNSLISKKISPLFSFFKMYAYSLKIIHCSLKCNQAR